ncbi:helix-turn-helix domain-containing protein [Oxynema aestuarii]|jgi:putative transposase|uniref:Helix-turn-helix domain-containing protein n=1 Tax=Oxynema aestuarii AP17 TaxID=2064643 RepID=A0A6H1U427_9CYAN|nr:helix-turn-helix domain-containing protein [Oxynema aestuarii]QIZ73186.1 helix-turn-helix domain-containing protein [Oxynema aestuarii AP17]RMH71355.1 MAG: helix-turn-helix domain-containing protein [Cyanobacteria bacterium J007]
MAGVLKLKIHESGEELKNLLAKQSTARGRERIQALYLLKIGQVKTLKELAILLGRDTATLYRWFQKYKAKGLDGMLEVKKGQGRKPAIPSEVMDSLRDRLQEPNGFQSYGEVKTWLKEKFDIDASYKVVHEAVRYKLKVKLKTSRKRRRKRDRDVQKRE